MVNTGHKKKAQAATKGNISPAPPKSQAEVTKKNAKADAPATAPKRRSARKKSEESKPVETAKIKGTQKSRKRGIEDAEETPAKKKGKTAPTRPTAARYPAAQLSEEEVTDADKVRLGGKGPSKVRPSKNAVEAATVESPDDTSADSDSGSEEYGADKADSSADSSSSEEEDSEPAPEKKAAVRKPSKKALETAMSERPFFPADEQPPDLPKGQRAKPVPIRVKMENANNDSADESEDEDEDDDGGHGAHHDDATRTARRIYKKALKTLKLKLYFENLFPTEAEKDGLPRSCWASAVASIGKIDGGSAAASKMLHDFGYETMLDKRVSSIRSSLVTKTTDINDRYYPTREKKSAALNDDRYVYPGDPDSPANADLVYRNDLICDILRRAFFSGRDTLPKLFPNELAGRINADGYIEMPETLVAAAATVDKIYGLLRRDTLPHAEGGWKFSADAHQSTYSKHIKSLKHLKSQNDVGYSVLLANIYRKASGVTVSDTAATASLVKMNPAGMSQTYD